MPTPVPGTYRGFTTGQIYEFSYSPIALIRGDKLQEYDKRPLLFFVNYDPTYRLISGLNLHWVTEDARKKFFQFIYRKYNIKYLSEWGVSINFTWQTVVSQCPWMGIAWRRYFPQRIRNIVPKATTYDKDEIFGPEVVKSDTAKIIGVTPEVIQRHIQQTIARKQRAVAQKHREVIAARNRGFGQKAAPKINRGR